MGLSAPYLWEVEHDRRRLAVSRWGKLIKALPTLDILTLAERSIESGPVEIDPTSLTPNQREALVAVLISTARVGVEIPKRSTYPAV